MARRHWFEPRIARETNLHWLREPLEGLKRLHEKGIMHRDVRPANMLIVSASPPRAMLCDFGKAIEAERSDDTAIGPVYTLAPEVWTTKTDGAYTSKIDAWAYGHAIAEILGYSIEDSPGADGPRHTNPQITRNRHVAMLEMLRAHSQMTPEDKPLTDLATKLLAWEPQQRWSAAQALEHDCWSPIISGPSASDGAKAGRKAEAEDEYANNGTDRRCSRPNSKTARASIVQPGQLVDKTTLIQ